MNASAKNSIDEYEVTAEADKEAVIRNILGVKSGKYTYYMDITKRKSSLMRVKDGYVYYVSNSGNAVRCSIADGRKERIVKGGENYFYAIYKNRIYFGANKKLNSNPETEYGVLKSFDFCVTEKIRC